MRLKDKYHWNGFIYELIYPGFVGSMIYELIPTTKTDASFTTYFTMPVVIKIFITKGRMKAMRTQGAACRPGVFVK